MYGRVRFRRLWHGLIAYFLGISGLCPRGVYRECIKAIFKQRFKMKLNPVCDGDGSGVTVFEKEKSLHSLVSVAARQTDLAFLVYSLWRMRQKCVINDAAAEVAAPNPDLQTHFPRRQRFW